MFSTIPRRNGFRRSKKRTCGKRCSTRIAARNLDTTGNIRCHLRCNYDRFAIPNCRLCVPVACSWRERAYTREIANQVVINFIPSTTEDERAAYIQSSRRQRQAGIDALDTVCSNCRSERFRRRCQHERRC